MSVRNVRALARVIIIIAMLAVLPCAATAGDLSPQPSSIAPVAEEFSAPSSAEDHEGFTTPLPGSVLMEKWNAARTQLRIDIDIIAACRADPAACESPAAKRMIAIVEEARKREGRARIGEINRAINLAVAAVNDKIQHGIQDKWASPLMTFISGRGDCEDYALAKYAGLRAAGFDEADLRLLIVRLPRSQTDHAVLSVWHKGRWLVLDNRRFAMLDAADLDAEPLFALRESNRPAYSATALDVEPYLL
jgi:predicted transglutaminase-like cysteine proteinase